MISNVTLKPILETLFPNVTVVPKQGNWFNPQDRANFGTWIAYIIRNQRPTATAFSQKGDSPVLGIGSEISTSYMIGDIELQIVGAKAEELAYAVAHWLNRSEIPQLFDTHYAQLCYQDLGRVVVSQFIQDGENSVLAYNVSFTLQWANMLNITYSKLDTAAPITGDLTIGV